MTNFRHSPYICFAAAIPASMAAALPLSAQTTPTPLSAVADSVARNEPKLPPPSWLNTAQGRYVFVPRGQGKVYEDAGEHDEIKLDSIQTEGRYTISDEHWHSGYILPAHYHDDHTEAFYVADGKLEITVGGETRTMTAGDILYVMPYTVHSARVAQGNEAHVLLIIDPAARPYPTPLSPPIP